MNDKHRVWNSNVFVCTLQLPPNNIIPKWLADISFPPSTTSFMTRTTWAHFSPSFFLSIQMELTVLWRYGVLCGISILIRLTASEEVSDSHWHNVWWLCARIYIIIIFRPIGRGKEYWFSVCCHTLANCWMWQQSALSQMCKHIRILWIERQKQKKEK